ncbi:hypothetical protein MUP46_01420 [Patescibacteria group bacterium]|nr:hypothetical protein [Patescibacteria group bacterium]
MAAKNKILVQVDEAANGLLTLMGTKAKARVYEDKENQAIRVDIETEDETGLLIGRHGETLASMETALGMMIRQSVGEWVRIIVNVGDWRERQEDHLKEIAEQAMERAIQTGEPQPIYNLTPAQRRIVHLALSESKDVETESVGEGLERYLVVKPKGKK